MRVSTLPKEIGTVMEIATARITSPLLPFHLGADSRFRRAALGIYPKETHREVDIFVLHDTFDWSNRARSRELERMFPDHRVISYEHPDGSFAVTFLVHDGLRTLARDVTYDDAGTPVAWVSLHLGYAPIWIYAPKPGFNTSLFEDERSDRQFVICHADGKRPEQRLAVAAPNELTHTEHTTTLPHGCPVADHSLFQTTLTYEYVVGPNALIAA
jgi:hypothetical protein